MALPFLDAMVPAMTAQSKTAGLPFRFGAIYMPNGVFLTRHLTRQNFQFAAMQLPSHSATSSSPSAMRAVGPSASGRELGVPQRR
jgi:hypothetical protein